MIEDDLRAMFARRAEDVRPPGDLLDGVRLRARRIRRRRGLAVASLAAAVVVMLTPAALLRHAPADRHRVTAAAPAPTPWLARSPANRLSWPERGRAAPYRFDAAVRHWLARDAARHGSRSTRIRRLPLWSGLLPGGRWAALLQVWNPDDPRRAHEWSTLLFTGKRNGHRLTVPYDLPTRFTHAGRGTRTPGTDRITGYGFDVGGAIVVVGAPGARSAAVTNGRRTSRKPLTDGAAVFDVTSGHPYRLFRLTAQNGTTLTPDDRHPGKGRGWHLDLTW